METPGYYTVGGAARALGVPVNRVRRWMDEGVLRGFRPREGGHRRISGESVLAVLRNPQGEIDRAHWERVQSGAIRHNGGRIHVVRHI